MLQETNMKTIPQNTRYIIRSIFNNSTNIKVPYCLQQKIKILILISLVYSAAFWLAVRIDWTVEEKNPTHNKICHKKDFSTSQQAATAELYSQLKNVPKSLANQDTTYATEVVIWMYFVSSPLVQGALLNICMAELKYTLAWNNEGIGR